MNSFSQQHVPLNEAGAEGQVVSDSLEAAQTVEQARQAIARDMSLPPVLLLPAPALIAVAPAPQTVIEALHSERAEDRVNARLATLSAISALDKLIEAKQSVDEMMSLLVAETAKARKRKWKRRVKLVGYLMFILGLLGWTHGHVDGNHWWFLYTVGSGLWAADRTWGHRHKAVSVLGKAGDPRAVGVLAIAARDAESAVRETAQKALLSLLPRVRADHASLITSEQMNALLELAFRSEPAMQIAVLQALQQIGDRRAIPVVENLSLSPNPLLRARAKECLPFLRERARREEASATLLRGASVPLSAAAPRELLRPVTHPAASAPPEELLRAEEQE